VILSQSIVTFIQGYEKCRLQSCMPTPNDKPTIGWGTTGSDIVMGMTWTQAQCDARFASDLDNFAQGVTSRLTGDTTQNQFDALLSLAYNIGLGNFGPSTVLRMHNAGDFAAVPAHFLDWKYQKGQVLQGLLNRREAEAKVYQGTQDA
jgi:GH24 family phage-related lysozyme (muramidase)